MTDEKPSFEGWAILEVEQMGRRRLGGYVAEAAVAGAGFLRIDVPGEEEPEATQFYSPSSVYCLTPVTEEMARAVAARSRPRPVQRWELPAAIERPVSTPCAVCDDEPCAECSGDPADPVCSCHEGG